MQDKNPLRKVAASLLATAATTLLTIGVLGASGASASPALVSVSMGTEP